MIPRIIPAAVGHFLSFVALFLFATATLVVCDRSWTTSPCTLEKPRAISSIVFYNNTFLIVGGCEEASCRHQSRAMTTFDAKNTVLQELPSLPIFVQYGRERVKVGVAGYYSALAVGQYDPTDNEVNTQVWVVGACSLHFSSPVSDVELLKYRSLWGLSPDLQSVDKIVQTHTSVPLRVNASCVTFGVNIYIIGGVLLDNLTLTSSVDVYNLYSDAYTHNAFQLSSAVMNAAVTIDNEMMYVGGGQTTPLCQARGGEGNAAVSSPIVQGYRFPAYWFFNETQLPTPVKLPQNPHLAGQHQEGRTLPRIFSFAGDLVMMHDTSSYSIFKLVEQTGLLADGTWEKWDSDDTGSELSTVLGFPQLDTWVGTKLTFYSFGGYNEKGNPVRSIFYRFTSNEIPRPYNPKLTAIVDEPYALTFEGGPSNLGNDWTARISPDVACYMSAEFIADVAITNYSAVFPPMKFASPKLYICVGRRAKSMDVFNATFFSAADPYVSIMLLPHIRSFAPPTPAPPLHDDSSSGMNDSDKGTIIFAVVLGVLVSAGVVGAAVAFQRAKRLQAALEDGLLDSDDHEETDSLVRNTTSDSRYRVIRRIGAGSFSTVFVVARKVDGEQFALKFMACADDRERLDAIKECETINSLQGHPNVITLYDMFMSYEFERKDSTLSDDGLSDHSRRRESSLDVSGYGALGNTPSATTPKRRTERTESLNSRTSSVNSSFASPVHTRYLCLVMEYHPAGDLAHWVLDAAYRDDRRGMSEAAIISVAYQLCSVLKHLHSQRPPVVHRDLKPENVLLRGTPSHKDTFLPVIVTDFGLAFIQEENRKGGKGGGTRPYIAPECWRGNVSTASDIWSLGCVLYAIATQRVTADTVRVMFLDAKSPHFHEDIQYDLRVHRYTDKFCRFVTSLLIPDPKQRPTAAELLTRFSAAGQSSPSAVHLS